MRHQRQRYQLSRSASHRKALLMNLSKEVIDHERIQTTEAKAKAVKPFAEKMITLAKRGDLHARRQALAALRSNNVVHQLFAGIVVIFELIALAWLRWRFFKTSFVSSLAYVTLAGLVIGAVSATLGVVG